MDENKRIIVLAGNRHQFQYWHRRNIIPITSPHDIEKLRGIRIHEVHKEGTWDDWMNREFEEIIRLRGGSI